MPPASGDAARAAARLRQIRNLLEESARNEETARRQLPRDQRLPADFEIKLLVERAELYCEESQIHADLLRTGGLPTRPLDDQQIVALAADLGLGRTLRDERRAHAAERGCTPACEVCITSCTECVTACGLDSNNFGSGCHQGSTISSCRPSPGN